MSSINTLVKISKSAGAMLKPHAPKLIPALLESLSVLEPQVLNYLSLRATEQEKDAMDSARLSAAKSSPMMETINMCLQYLDVSVLGELVPRLCELIRSGVGLGTKVRFVLGSGRRGRMLVFMHMHVEAKGVFVLFLPFGYLPLLLSTLAFEKDSITEQGTH